MSFKGVILNINEQQPIDDVMTELEHLGFMVVNHHLSRCNVIVASLNASNPLEFDYWTNNIKPVTLTELKQMEK